MAFGAGKHTIYYDQTPPATKAKQTFLAKLFTGDPNPTEGTQAKVIARVQKFLMATGNPKYQQANNLITDTGDQSPDHSDKNPLFPGGVSLAYYGPNGDPNDVDVSKVAFNRPGDPVNPYVPDIRSPGDSWTLAGAQGDARQTDPAIKTGDIKPNLVTTDLAGGEANPAKTGIKIHEVVQSKDDTGFGIFSK